MASQFSVTCRLVALEFGGNPSLLSRWKWELEEVSPKALNVSGTPSDVGNPGQQAAIDKYARRLRPQMVQA
jgi:transposase-like protein